MSASDLNAKLQQAIALAQSGQRAEARALLEEVVAADPSIEMAWLWLATVSTDRNERIGFLERALTLNPNNSTSQAAYTQLTGETFVPAGGLPPLPPEPTAGPIVPPTRRNNLLLIGAIAAIAVFTVMIAVFLRNAANEPDLVEELTQATVVIPSLESPTLLYTLTPSNTPQPTATPGPSRTPVTLPPTWTPSASFTPRPTRTSPPTWTPPPTATLTLTPTDTYTPGPPTETPTPSNTPNSRTMTAAVPLTSEAATNAAAAPPLSVTEEVFSESDGEQIGDGVENPQ